MSIYYVPSIRAGAMMLQWVRRADLHPRGHSLVRREYAPRITVLLVPPWWLSLFCCAQGYCRVFEPLPCYSSDLNALFGHVLGDPKTTLWLDGFARRIHRTQESIILMVTVYHSERKQIKLRKGKRLTGQSLGETKHRFLGVLSQWSLMGSLHSPRNNVWQLQ